MAKLAIGSAVVVGALWAFLEFQPFQHHATSFEIPQGCRSDGLDFKEVYAPNRYAQEWEREVLIIRVGEKSNCGDTVGSVSAHVVGSHVLLRLNYVRPHGFPPTACLCRHNTVVRLKGLENRIYSIHRIGIAYNDGIL